jgi:hypothetical protein
LQALATPNPRKLTHKTQEQGTQNTSESGLKVVPADDLSLPLLLTWRSEQVSSTDVLRSMKSHVYGSIRRLNKLYIETNKGMQI